MRVISWNINGIRAAARKGLGDWLNVDNPAVLGLQEVRATLEQIPAELRESAHRHAHFSAAERKGYSGVGLLSRLAPDRVETDLGEARFDIEGRLQIAHFGRLAIANVYFPNGNGKDRDNSRVPYKLDFYRLLFDRLQSLRRGGRRVLVMGDFNTAHKAIDLARPKENRKTSGFLPEECAEMDRWIAAGWIDTFRHFEKDPCHYSWWSQRMGARARNVGWRIDYILASPAAMKSVRSAFILPQVMGSDHCPVGVELDPGITG